MSHRLVIFGTSGNALDVLDIVDSINERSPFWEVVGILDDAQTAESDWHGLTVLGKLADAVNLQDCWFVNAIGSDHSYHQRPRLVAASGIEVERFATLIHPLAAVSLRAHLGRGV